MFQELPEHEKEVYQEMARQDKANKRYRPARNDRMDCTGEYISVSFFFAKEGLFIECHKSKTTVFTRDSRKGYQQLSCIEINTIVVVKHNNNKK